MKLEPKFLTPYLSHKVECSYLEWVDEKKRLKAILTGVNLDGIETTFKRQRRSSSNTLYAGDLISWDGNNNIHDLQFKLHLRPLSDLFRVDTHTNIDELSLYALEYIESSLALGIDEGQSYVDNIPFDMVQYLISKHYDIYGLIKENLAIDINKIV